MAVIKHIASKNADYTAAERYLVFQHDEKTQKMLRDEEGYPIVRENYLLAGVNCDPYNFRQSAERSIKGMGKIRTSGRSRRTITSSVLNRRTVIGD